MSRSSLRLRLTAGGVLAIVLALVLVGSALLVLFERHVIRTVGEELEFHAGQIIAGIDTTPTGTIDVVRPPTDPRFQQPLSGLYWQVVAKDATALRSRSLWDVALDLPADALEPGAAHLHRMAGPGKSQVLVIERGIQMTRNEQRVPIRLAVATDIARVTRAASAFARELVIALTLSAMTLALATEVQVSLGLRPLERLRRQVAAVRSGASRQIASSAPVEVQPLVDELNGLLASQEREIARSRGRTADLAHGLKTPLAALITDAARLSTLGHTEIARGIEQTCEAMSRHVDRELARARVLGGSGKRPSATLLLPLVNGLAATVTRAHPGKPLAVDLAIPEALELPIDRTDLAEVLGNLLENSARHARHRIRVTATAKEGTETVAIEDDGQGISEAQRARLLRRGERLDTTGNGAGLGLAIVQDVLEAYGWALVLEASSDLGGLRAVMRAEGGAGDRMG